MVFPLCAQRLPSFFPYSPLFLVSSGSKFSLGTKYQRMHARSIQTILTAFLYFFIAPLQAQTQLVADDFEGNGTINSWTGDDCEVLTGFANPSLSGINTSAKVLRYRDQGGQYANIRFDVGNNFDLSVNRTFKFKIYVPSSGLIGAQTNQVSLKLQDASLGSPWTTQCEIIKPIQLNVWQEVSFNFGQDTWANFDLSSPPPTQRLDFNRVLIQVNGENNNAQVTAFIDDFLYDGTVQGEQVFNNLVWADEFETDGPVNSSKWFHQTQLPASGGWHNNEVQHYTNRTANSFVSNGTLKIVAKRENFTSQGVTKAFTSARLNSKFAFTYGKIEFRAKLLNGVGTWPALWTLGKNINEAGAYWQTQGFGTTGWPACGEIDVMEHWGTNPNFVQSATHTPSSFGGTVNKGGQQVPTAFTEFHTYAVEWHPKRLIFSVDGQVHYIYKPTFQNPDTWPFTAAQYLIMNIAIEPGIAPSFSQGTMELDYVRVYQASPTSVQKTASVARSIQLFPNPVENELQLEVSDAFAGKLNLQILNSEGRLVRFTDAWVSEGVCRFPQLGTLPSGLYVLRVSAEGQDPQVLRFVKE